MTVKYIIIEPSYVLRSGLTTLMDEISNIEVIGVFSDLTFLNESMDFETVDFILINPSVVGRGYELENLKLKYQAKLVAISMELHYRFRSHFNSTLSILGSKQRVIENIEALQLEGCEDECPEGIEELSEREIDVLRCVALGLTNKEIAEELFISTHTVISHRKNITRKLGIKTVSGLTVYAIMNKYIDVTSVNS